MYVKKIPYICNQKGERKITFQNLMVFDNLDFLEWGEIKSLFAPHSKK